MSVNPEIAGVTAKHIGDIEKVCRDLNTFIFLRPSTKETMQLIDQGYATKSMDIHDKSSDWGPASGFVPCDGAFSKAVKGAPNPHPDYHAHGDAKPVHLKLTDALANPGSNPKLALDHTQQSTLTVRYVTANPKGVGPKGLTFKLEKEGNEWAVYWMNKDAPIKLYVWGYATKTGVKPVTGDYDMWMVAPHIERWQQHSTVMGIKDSHGESGATKFITWLLIKLNEACGRADNHVFHHGAESQNYGFTQAIDPSVAMFTPAGTSEMITINDLPDVLIDLQTAGYLVYWNKRYGESDPHLMGQAVNAGVSGGPPGKTAIEALMMEATAVQSVAPIGGTDGRPVINLGESKAQALIRKNLLGRGGEVPKIEQIQTFNKALEVGMKSLESARSGGTLRKLKVPVHIPKSVMDKSTGDLEGLALQRELQRAVMELSTMDEGFGRTGAVLAPSPEKWKEWESKNQGLFARLQQKFGVRSRVPLRFDRVTGTRAYTASEVPDPYLDGTVDRMLGPFASLFKTMFPV